MPLLILNANPTEPTDYTDRPTVKAVILDNNGNTVHLGSNIIGGGVEAGETDEDALHREILEEVGMRVKVIKPLGEVIGYRDSIKKKYIIHGYLCTYIDTVPTGPTTPDIEKLDERLVWEPLDRAIAHYQKEIDEIEAAGPDGYERDAYQQKLYNRQMSLAFLLEAQKERVNLSY